jgi:hypothetical protein
VGLSDIYRTLDIWGTPTDYNRAARRSVGLYSSMWKSEDRPNPDLPPRYVRRHHAPDVLINPKTRRERRHRARILRAMEGRL